MTGDQSDFTTRIKSTLPRWFGDTSSYLDAVIAGLANGWAFAYSLYAYAKLQTRIKTATDGWLDFIAWDFFGPTLQRQTNQSDTSFRARILINLFRERGTRNAITKVLLDITGRAPIIFEPKRPLDTGAYNQSVNGYGLAGAYGSMLLPYQCFVTAFRPTGSGIPNVAGYGVSTGAYNTASQVEYASMNMIQGAVTDADIFAAIDSVTTCATTAWTRILS
jgi:hypothetical protein